MGSGSMGGAGGRSAAAMHVEGQNDERLDGLLGKVKILKDITVGIGDEVRASNMELGGMVSFSLEILYTALKASESRRGARRASQLTMTERRVHFHVQLSQWHVQTNDQDGKETRRDLVLLLGVRLVLSVAVCHCVVVEKMRYEV